MGLTLRLVAGLLLVLIGAVWALQGVGVIGGSVMTNSPFWLVVGLVLVVVGIALVARRPARRR